jgi:hypothetical protein
MAAPAAPAAAEDSSKARARAAGAAYLEKVLAAGSSDARGGAPAARHATGSSFFEPRRSGVGDGVAFGGAGAGAPRGPRVSATFVRGRGVAAYVDPDVLAMGSFLEHARAGAVLALFGATTAAQLVLAKRSVAVLPGAQLTLLLIHLLPSALLCRAAQQHEVVDAPRPSAARALITLPNAAAHAALALCALCALGGGSVELFLALTAALAPPLAAALDAALSPGVPEPLSARRRHAAAAGAAACAVCVLSERGDSAGAYIALAAWFAVWAAERAWETLMLSPPPDAAGGEDGGAGAGGAVGALARVAHGAASALAAAARGLSPATPPGPPSPPSAFEKALYGNSVCLPLLPPLLLLRGELGAIAAAELSVPALTTLALSAAAAAGGTAAALLATDVMEARALALVTTGCNAATLLISHAVAEEPHPTLLGLAAAVVAVFAGAAFKLLPSEHQ